jgi:hypothetical protein
MRDWIVVVVLYLVGIGLFRILGGFGAAANAFRRWGKATSSLRNNPSSS